MTAGSVLAGSLLAGCTGEEATPVDLDATTSTTAVVTAPPFDDEIDPDDPNAAARSQVVEAARQQCLDDPELDEGVVQLVLEESGEIASEYRVDCDEVRAEQSEG